MTRRLAPSALVILAGALLGLATPDYDILFVGGTVVDGTGAPRRQADVAVSGERIAAVGDLRAATARRVVDARGLVVAPGFIDMLGWSEFNILVDNRGVSKVTQGVTTEITGEGWSVAPVNANTLRDDSAQYAAWHLVVDWHDLDGYFARLERSGTPFNIGTYVGATQVRKFVIGDAHRDPTPSELSQMEALVDTAMRQGAMGLSTSLGYAPAVYAKTSELIALARVAGRHGGVYATHLRSEGSGIRSALREAFRIGREAHTPVEVWHLKLSGRPQWGQMRSILALFDSARASGVRAWANSYPYTASANDLASIVPAWAHAGGKDSLLARLRDPATRVRIRREMAGPQGPSSASEAGSLRNVVVLAVLDTTLRRYQGKRITEIAAEEHKDPYDALFDLILADHANTGRATFTMSDADVRLAVATPWVAVGSDFGARGPDGPLAQPGHPRGYGAFTRILGHYVRDLHALSLETAVRKMSGLAAERMGLRDRGLVRAGYYADLAVFDPATVRDRATFENSTALSEGVKYVVVNGHFTLDDGRLTGERPGRPLRGPGWSAP